MPVTLVKKPTPGAYYKDGKRLVEVVSANDTRVTLLDCASDVGKGMSFTVNLVAFNQHWTLVREARL